MGIVWILGAGFSKPLGGPLLGKMLSPESERDLGVRYPRSKVPQLWTPQIDSARRLYYYGRGRSKEPNKTGEGEDLWEDAEEYLDYLDTAAAGGAESPASKRLLQILSYSNMKPRLPDGAPVLTLLAAAGRRLLAAECCSFLEEVDPNSERWSPYQRWLREVFVWGEDTVVTFNYDLVLERLARSRKRVSFQYRERGPDSALLLKLHGSVNWLLRGSQAVDTDAEDRAALTCNDDQLAIAGPGPGKQKLSSSGGPFEWCWTEARAALEKANAIVFIGYRFPPTDAEARERLLGAIRKNKECEHLAIHTVLGPNTSSDNSLRLKGLLQHALAGVRKPAAAAMLDHTTQNRWYSLVQQPLGTEDFFSVVERDSILHPIRWD